MVDCGERVCSCPVGSARVMIDKRRRMIIKGKTKMGFSEAKEGVLLLSIVSAAQPLLLVTESICDTKNMNNVSHMTTLTLFIQISSP